MGLYEDNLDCNSQIDSSIQERALLLAAMGINDPRIALIDEGWSWRNIERALGVEAREMAEDLRRLDAALDAD